MGRLAFDSMFLIRLISSLDKSPSSIESIAAICIPIETASPCKYTPYPKVFSIPCPKVWPKFNNALLPFSNSSKATIRALSSHERKITSVIKSLSLFIINSIFSSIIERKSALPRSPYLMTSAIPAENSRSFKVSKVFTSIMTAFG